MFPKTDNEVVEDVIAVIQNLPTQHLCQVYTMDRNSAICQYNFN